MERRAAYLRPDEIRTELSQNALVYLPLGPLEWHAPHLPVGTDPLHAEQAALAASQMTGGLVYPTLYWGTERDRSPQMLDWIGLNREQWVVGMDFAPGGLPSHYAFEDVFGLVLREQLRLIFRWPVKLVVIISGHGATNHLQVLERLAAESSAENHKVLVVLPFVSDEQGVMRVGHASRIETSTMLYLTPGRVKINLLPAPGTPLLNANWAVVDYATFAGQPTPERTVSAADDPRLSTAQEGEQFFEIAVSHIVQLVDAEKKNLD
jgi:creatinine amidohydrolase